MYAWRENAAYSCRLSILRPDLQNILRFIIRLSEFIVRSTYDGDLKHAKISLMNIVSKFTNTVSDDLTILRVNRI